ncbi:MAG TPA: bifunctional PIG-L family deacetylase/class I SAM-dependent methyltransferase [Pseudonocardia sp.]
MTRSSPTAPKLWRQALAHHRPRRLDIEGLGRLVVVAAHPDDETLAVSGVMQAAHAHGCTVELVIGTDGEAAFPDLDRSGRDALARTRRAELATALREQGLGAVPVRWLGLPDSALNADAMADELVGTLAGADSYLAPWSGDPHPDHAAAGLAAASAAPVTAHGWSYPIWMWPWLDPTDPAIPWSMAFQHTLSSSVAARKHSALSSFTSQLNPGPGGAEPILTAATLRYFRSDRELVFRCPPTSGAPVERFSRLYREGGGDPWHTGSSWYEARKRDVLLACLPEQRYLHAAEPGCGTGLLTRELTRRCDRVSASDFTPDAVALAREATAGLAGVSVARRALPDGVPDGIDLAVLSEVLYYLDPVDLAATHDRLAAALVPGGDLVVAHWRGWPSEAPQEAAEVHRRFTGDPRFDTLVEHLDSEFLLHVLRRR